MNEHSVSVNIHVLELLSSRICHDLISPVSAINNGMELFEELGPEAGDEVTELIGHSARQASRKLQLMRFAFGAGGNDPSIKPSQVFEAFKGFIEADNKVELHVPSPDRQMPLVEMPAINRIMACLFLLAYESMPRGGVLQLTCDAQKLTFSLQGVEEKLWNVACEKINKTTLNAEEAELDPKTIHPYVTGLFLRNYGYRYELEEVSDQSATIQVTAPASP